MEEKNKKTTCQTCGGTGLVEIMEHKQDDSTGYNFIAEGTGTYQPCPDCYEA